MGEPRGNENWRTKSEQHAIKIARTPFQLKLFGELYILHILRILSIILHICTHNPVVVVVVVVVCGVLCVVCGVWCVVLLFCGCGTHTRAHAHACIQPCSRSHAVRRDSHMPPPATATSVRTMRLLQMIREAIPNDPKACSRARRGISNNTHTHRS